MKITITEVITESLLLTLNEQPTPAHALAEYGREDDDFEALEAATDVAFARINGVLYRADAVAPSQCRLCGRVQSIGYPHDRCPEGKCAVTDTGAMA